MSSLGIGAFINMEAPNKGMQETERIIMAGCEIYDWV